MKKVFSSVLLVVLALLANAFALASTDDDDFFLFIEEWTAVSLATNRMDIFIRFYDNDFLRCRIVSDWRPDIDINVLPTDIPMFNLAIDSHMDTITTGTVEIWLPCREYDVLSVMTGSGWIIYEDYDGVSKVRLESCDGGKILFEYSDQWEKIGTFWLRE